MAIRRSADTMIRMTYRDGQGAAAPGGYVAPFYDCYVVDATAGLSRRFRIDADRSAVAPWRNASGRGVSCDSSQAYTMIAADIVRDLFASDEPWGVSATLTTDSGREVLRVLIPAT